jgi:hypothetical protein
VPAGRSEHGDRSALDDAGPWYDPPEPGVEFLEGGPGPSRWRTRWAGLPTGARRLLVLLAVLVVLGAGGLRLRDWSAERELRQRVELATSFGVWSSSTSPPGGAVGFFLLVRNDGARPVWITGVDGEGDRVRLRMRVDGQRLVEAGREIEVPMSVRLTCDAGDEPSGSGLSAAITVRREDGASVTRRTELRPAAPVLDVAASLCQVRPDLRDHELSGPVIRASG